ncbi:MAG: hypothetical protein K2Q25_09035, partial [Mycobacteriaceae bacterium]|nr:hypothetical protein [Mycobacteriaceae bacterium]
MELYLAVAALFGGVLDLGINAASGDWDSPQACDIVPTALDVSILLGQGALVAGKVGGLNWLERFYPDPESAIEMSRLSKGTASTAAETASLDSAPLLSAAERDVSGLAKPGSAQGIGQHFASPLFLLQLAINIVEWAIVPFFGFEIPDEGHSLDRSKDNFSAAYAALDLAMPDPGQWSGSAANAYTADTEILQDLADQAGIDGMLTRLLGSSIDTELQGIIERQAREVQLMRMALAIIVAGLTFSCIPIALAMEACAPRSSLTFQIMMFIAGVSAALGVVITLAVWTSDNARDLRRVAGKYRELIAQVPLSVPAMPPGAELVPAVTPLSRFADLAVSATPGSAGPVDTPSTPRGRPQAPTTPPSPSQPQLVPPQAVARLSAVQQNLTFRP